MIVPAKLLPAVHQFVYARIGQRFPLAFTVPITGKAMYIPEQHREKDDAERYLTEIPLTTARLTVWASTRGSFSFNVQTIDVYRIVSVTVPQLALYLETAATVWNRIQAIHEADHQRGERVRDAFQIQTFKPFATPQAVMDACEKCLRVQ